MKARDWSAAELSDRIYNDRGHRGIAQVISWHTAEKLTGQAIFSFDGTIYHCAQSRSLTLQTMRISFRAVTGSVGLAQTLALIVLLRHESASGAILGRYSPRYALVLALALLAVIASSGALLFAGRLERWLTRWTLRSRLLVTGPISALATLIWLLPVELTVKQFAAISALSFTAIVMFPAREIMPDRVVRAGRMILPGAIALIVVLSGFTALTEFPFSPDEAHWADYASTAVHFGGIYARRWMMEPQLIVPGLGWSIAAYGQALEHIAFDIRTGRLWVYACYLLTLIGVWLLARRLYDRPTAWVSAALAAFSGVFFPAFDYRPHHQLGAATVFVGWLALIGQTDERAWARRGGAFAAGLLALLSLQLHAAGLALAIGCSVFMAIAVLRAPRRLDAFAAYAAGAGVGALVYWFFNIVPAGGIGPFLTGLVTDRGERQTWLYFLTWPTLLEGLILYAGLLFVLLRWSPADRRLLSLALPVFISMAIIDTQGYRTLTAPLFVIVAAAALTPSGAGQAVAARRWIGTAAVLLMLGASAATNLNWSGLIAVLRGQGLPNYVYADLAGPLTEYIDAEDVIASTHMLIWTLPDHLELYSTAGEYGVMRQSGLSDPQQVWEAVQPTLVIDIPGQMLVTEGLQQYMQAHDFGLCQSLRVEHLTVDLYRAGC